METSKEESLVVFTPSGHRDYFENGSTLLEASCAKTRGCACIFPANPSISIYFFYVILFQHLEIRSKLRILLLVTFLIIPPTLYLHETLYEMNLLILV